MTETRKMQLRAALRKYRNSPEGRRRHVEGERRRQWEAKLECLAHYGGDPPKCACCGETEVGFLTLDHLNKDGFTYKKTLSSRFFLALKRNGFPNDPPLQVLCWNCNMGRTYNHGVCPHQQPMTMETYGTKPRRIEAADCAG